MEKQRVPVGCFLCCFVLNKTVPLSTYTEKITVSKNLERENLNLKNAQKMHQQSINL